MPDSNDPKAVREFIRLTYQDKRWVATEGAPQSRATRRNSGSKGRTSSVGEYDDTPQPEPLSNILGDDIPALALGGQHEPPRAQPHTSAKNDLLLINWDTPVAPQSTVPSTNSNPFMGLNTAAHNNTNTNPFFAPQSGTMGPSQSSAPLFNPFQAQPLPIQPLPVQSSQPTLFSQTGTSTFTPQPHSFATPSSQSTAPLTFTPTPAQSFTSTQTFAAPQPHAVNPSAQSFGQFVSQPHPAQSFTAPPTQPFTQPQPHFTPTPTPQSYAQPQQPVITAQNAQMAYQQLTPQQIQMLQQITPQQLQQMTPVQQQQFAILLQQMRQQQQMQMNAQSTPQVSQQVSAPFIYWRVVDHPCN
jgi:hypothetical protein